MEQIPLVWMIELPYKTLFQAFRQMGEFMMKKLCTGKRAGVIFALLLSLVVLFGVHRKVSAQEIVPTSGIPQNQLFEGCGIAEHSPQPKIEVDFWNNSIIMKNWFLSPSVDLYIDQVFIESGYLIRGIFSSLQSTRINTGNVITLQSDTYSTTYTVGVLKTTSYDRDSRVLTGIASPGELVVTLPGNPGKNIILQVGQSGVWTFTIPDEVSIGSGTRIKLTQFDRKGNSLTNQYLIGYPSFTFYKGEGVIGSSHWPPLTSIIVKVNDQVLDTVLTDSNGSITYSAHYDFVIGDVIRLSGSGYSIDHTIGLLSVDTIDVANNFIAGKALPGSLHVSDRPLYAGMDVEVDANGNWQAYFTESNPWEDDVSGYLQQCQPQHGCQHLWWNNPQHLIVVDPASDQVETNRWEPYSDLQITIASQTWNVTTDYSGYAEINTGAYDIIGGDLVTITDGVRTKNYNVTNMAISNVDPINRLVEGTADPNTSVLIYKSNSHNDPWEMITVDSTGNWQFVFRDDIFPDTTVFVKQTDSAGNMTQIVWKYGSPTIWAYPNDNIVIGRNWTANLPVTLTIEGQTWTQTPDANGLVEFDLGSFNLEPNQVLEMSNSVQSQSYQTREIYITSIKAFTSVVSGFVNSNSVIVKACAPLYHGCFFRTANTDGNGNWQADFKPDLRFNSEYYGTVYLYDNELNGTLVDWKMPSDYLNLLLAPWSNAISSSYWSTHSLVSLLIDGVEIVNNQPAVNRVVNFLNIPSELLVPGKVITLKDENFSISYVIGTFELTLADPLANVLVGSSGNRYVLVEVCNGRCENMIVFPEYDPSSGKYIWMADFNGVLDITNDSFGTISSSDYDGNTTQYHWRAFSSCYNFLPVISRTD